jgi:hypothetical protein
MLASGMLASAGVCAMAVPSARAEDNTQQQLRLPPTETLAAGANGKPLVFWTPRADLGLPGEDMLWGIHFGGHVDAGYLYNTDPLRQLWVNTGTKLERMKFDPVQVPGRLFDTESNAGWLDQADLYAARAVDPTWRSWDLGAKVEGMYGWDARYIHANGLNFYGSDSPQPSPDNQFDLTQAYADVTMPIGSGARVRLGKVASPIGVESIDPTVTPFYSRGLIMTFKGFRSRWMTPRAWASCTASASLRTISAAWRCEMTLPAPIRSDRGRPSR